MNRVEWAGLVVGVLFVAPFLLTGLVWEVADWRSVRRSTGLDLLGVVYMPRAATRRRRGGKKKQTAAPLRDFPIRRRPTERDLSRPRGFWDGSSFERTLVHCADGCTTWASAEFTDHGGVCQASVARHLIIPHSGVGIVRAAAHAHPELVKGNLLATLRLHRPRSQSHLAVIEYALAIAIERRWIEPVAGDPNLYRSLLWALGPAELAERTR